MYCKECGQGENNCMCKWQNKEVVLRYFDISGELAMSTLLLDDQTSIKDKVLKNLNITRKEGEKHLDSYLRAMAEENELPVQKPAHPVLSDAILQNGQALRLIFVLA